jgi:DNA-binding transcriptional regulator/RsmH inhibitor MraZ
MEQYNVKIDSDGRMYLPKKVRQELGNTVVLKKAAQGYLLTSKQYVANEKLKKTLNSTISRTGKPHLATPQEMKSIRDPTKRDPNLKPPTTKNS